MRLLCIAEENVVENLMLCCEINKKKIHMYFEFVNQALFFLSFIHSFVHSDLKTKEARSDYVCYDNIV